MVHGSYCAALTPVLFYLLLAPIPERELFFLDFELGACFLRKESLWTQWGLNKNSPDPAPTNNSQNNKFAIFVCIFRALQHLHKMRNMGPTWTLKMTPKYSKSVPGAYQKWYQNNKIMHANPISKPTLSKIGYNTGLNKITFWRPFLYCSIMAPRYLREAPGPQKSLKKFKHQ